MPQIQFTSGKVPQLPGKGTVISVTWRYLRGIQRERCTVPPIPIPHPQAPVAMAMVLTISMHKPKFAF